MCKVNRHFYRCPDCLSVCAVNAESQQWNLTCKHCDTILEYMGRVSGDHMVKDEIRCACDDRCTSARGPKCDCHCGGKNHGTNAIVVVTVYAGKLIAETRPTAKQLAEAREWRETRDEALNQWRTLNRRRCSGEYLGSVEFRRMNLLDRQIGAARKLRTHVSRMKALAAAGVTPPPRPTLASVPDSVPEYLEPVTTAPRGQLF